jgi:hypothetical protein
MNKRHFFRSLVAVVIGLASITMFSGCDLDDEEEDNETEEPEEEVVIPISNDIEGVVINGIRWATRNIDESGRFTSHYGQTGRYFQWNRIKAWTGSMDKKNWDDTSDAGPVWEKLNDPSPEGWRLPTLDDFEKLFDTEKVTIEWVWVMEYSIYGTKFTDETNGNAIFLPIKGFLNDFDGTPLLTAAGGLYWTGTPHELEETFAYAVGLYKNGPKLGSILRRNYGFLLRCVAE